jgi:hypothetical protein
MDFDRAAADVFKLEGDAKSPECIFHLATLGQNARQTLVER